MVLVVKGDTNLDGKISNADATKIKAYLQETAELDAVQIFVADTDGNGRLSNADAIKIKSSLSTETPLPW